MPNSQIKSLTVDGVTYDIVDKTSGYITGISSSDVTTALGFTPYNSTNPNGYTSNTGTITSVQTTAGAHTTINISSGAASFNVPTKTSHLTNDSGFITSYTDEKVKQESLSGTNSDRNIIVTPSLQSTSTITNQVAYAQYFKYNDSTGGITLVNPSNSTQYMQFNHELFYYHKGQHDLYIYSPTTLTDTRIINIPNKSGTLALTSDIPTVPTKVSDLTNDSGFITSYTETDPVFSASAAAGITSTDISNWNAKVSDTGKWNGVELANFETATANDYYVPAKTTVGSTSGTASWLKVTRTPGNYSIAQYDNGYLKSTTPSANDNSTKVATTAYVDAAIPDVSGFITTDTNTTYALSNALSSHKFTSTLTAGGSGSGTSTATMEFAAGTGITLTDDTSNKKITIACSVSNTDEKVKYDKITTNQAYSIMLSNLASSSDTSPYTSTLNRTGTLTYNPSTKALVTGGTVDGYTLAAASAKAVDTSISTGSSSANLPTSAAVASFVESKNYLTLATLPIYDGTVV